MRNSNCQCAIPEEVARVQPKRLVFSVREAAAVLGIGKDLCYELIGRGELPHLRLGKRVVVPIRALTEFVDAVDH